jgi:putative transposase
VRYLHDTYRVSERRACRLARAAVSTFRHENRQELRTALRLRIREVAQTQVRYGYRKIRVLLNREAGKVGKQAGVSGCTVRKARRCVTSHDESGEPRCITRAIPADGSQQMWGLDFVADQLVDGQRFRALTILDLLMRGSLAIEVGQKLKGDDVVLC